MGSRLVLCGALLAAALSSSACGDDPADIFHRQVLFRLEARGGGGCVQLDHIASGGARHELEPGRLLILDEGASMTLLLANSPPPYRGRFAWTAEDCPDVSGQIVVSALEVQGPSAEPQALDAANPSVTVDLRRDVAGPLAADVEQPRVRFEVCAPPTREEGCTASLSGRVFTGTMGDARLSHILSVLEANDAATTPAILFLEGPRDRVSGLFRGATGQLLRGELYVNDVLVDVGLSTGDVVLQDDI